MARKRERLTAYDNIIPPIDRTETVRTETKTVINNRHVSVGTALKVKRARGRVRFEKLETTLDGRVSVCYIADSGFGACRPEEVVRVHRST